LIAFAAEDWEGTTAERASAWTDARCAWQQEHRWAEGVGDLHGTLGEDGHPMEIGRVDFLRDELRLRRAQP
jgi:hypothetical protein